jgi:hypothetical protein
MDPRFHKYFDLYYFTIIRDEDQFNVKVGTSFYPHDTDLSNIDGKQLYFGDQQHLWPSTAFLKFHNRKFEYQQMKAAAEPKHFDRNDSDLTIVHNFESLDFWKGEWIKAQDVNQYEDIENKS